jgi:hypothetical protein
MVTSIRPDGAGRSPRSAAAARVTQRRSIAAGQHGRRVARERQQQRMPDRIHAVVEAVEPANGKPVPDLRRADTGSGQLSPAHDTVLASRHAGDRDVRMGNRLAPCRLLPSRSPLARWRG